VEFGELHGYIPGESQDGGYGTMPQGLKILLTTSVLIAAFTGLMWTSMQDGTAYYKHVDEVMVEPEAWVGKRLQVHGYASNITWKPSTMDYRFQIENNGHVIQAEYTGVVPDTFQDEAEVVVSGRLEGHTLIVESDGIMAKCPSKYEAKPTLGASIGSLDDGGSVSGSEAVGVSN
jgi:cytochrome c-type biogenesis protein CcmE